MNNELIHVLNDTIKFENGVGKIDLPTLKQTVRYEMANGKLPKNRPVEHFQLIDDLCEVAQDNGLVATPGEIWAAERQAMRINWNGKREDCPIDHFLIQRLVNSIHLNRDSEDGQNMGIGIAYHERGIDLAFGVNVWACSNMQIFGEHHLRTYGKGKTNFREMMDRFKNWMEEFSERRDFQMGRIEELSNFEISPDQMDETIGELFRLAVDENSGKAEQPAPLNQAQVADLVKASHDELYHHEGSLTAYDLVQWGTHYLKPDHSDLVTLIDHNHRFCDFVTDKFSVN